MRGLGEDPAHFQELLEALWEEWNPVGSLQEGVVIRLARVMWLMNRADRSQEGAALRRAQSADQGRDNRLHARMMRLKMTVQTLRSLARSVAEWHYVTTNEDLEVMKKLHQEGVAGEMGEIAMDLFYQLREPNADKDGVSEEEKYSRRRQQLPVNLWIRRNKGAGLNAYPLGRANNGPARGLRRSRGLS